MATVGSFFGLQTTLRGLLAQQRLLDTTGHNIANANTAGYSRQEAVLQASPALEIDAGGTASGAPAHLGSGVDVESFSRIRDLFTDLQYRAQNSLSGNATAQANALDQAQTALAEPGEDGLNAQLSAFWDAWSDLADANDGNALAAKQAVVEAGQSLADAFSAVRGQFADVAQQTYAQYQDLTRPASGTDPGGAIAQAAKQLADLNATIKRAVTVGDQPNDLMDRRDQLLDQLSGYGQISVTDNGDGSVDVAFVDTQSAGTTYGIVSGSTVDWSGAPSSWSPGGTLGGLLAAGDPTTGTVTGYVATLDGLATQIASLVNGAYGGTFFQTGPGPAGASLAVDPALAAAPSAVVTGSGGAGSNDIALAVSQLRGNAAVDGAYQAFVAKVGAEVSAADRTEANAKALLDNVSDRRQSISGVSLDEEMTNLIQFQRGYQASARAMSTMDDLLDVLINRTGRVGL
jgi:flagellar hook-associated protein 1 FlgK